MLIVLCVLPSGVFLNLRAGHTIDCHDIDSAINGICEEQLVLEIDITKFVQCVCTHIRQKVDKANLHSMQLEDMKKAFPKSPGKEETEVTQHRWVFTLHGRSEGPHVETLLKLHGCVCVLKSLCAIGEWVHLTTDNLLWLKERVKCRPWVSFNSFMWPTPGDLPQARSGVTFPSKPVSLWVLGEMNSVGPLSRVMSEFSAGPHPCDLQKRAGVRSSPLVTSVSRKTFLVVMSSVPNATHTLRLLGASYKIADKWKELGLWNGTVRAQVLS